MKRQISCVHASADYLKLMIIQGKQIGSLLLITDALSQG